MSKTRKRFDFVVFGVSGYCGLLVAECVDQLVREQEHDLTWAVAGRSEKKVKEAMEEVKEITGHDLSRIPIIIADVNDPESLDNMAKQARVILNLVGPYTLYAPPVIEACIAHGTHHVDITAEDYYLETTQMNYHEKAKKGGSYIVGGCGWDAICSEIAVLYMMKHFEGQLHSIQFAYQSETDYFTLIREGMFQTVGPGTFSSFTHMFNDWPKLKGLRKKLYPKPMPQRPYPPKRSVILYDSYLKAMMVHFPGIDKSCIYRGQRYNYEHRGMRPIMFRPYVKSPSLFVSFLAFLAIPLAVLILPFLLLYFVCVNFELSRNFLKAHPTLFTLGLIQKRQNRKALRRADLSCLVAGLGYAEKLSDPNDDHPYPPNMRLVVKQTLLEHGYYTNVKGLIQSALTILRETDKLPETGGVLTIGAAFLDTTMLERCEKHLFKFTVEKEK